MKTTVPEKSSLKIGLGATLKTMEKDRYSAPPKMNFASLEKTGLWLYVLIMAIFFGMQALSSVESYLGKKVRWTTVPINV